ncbi:MAG: hypothetical protein ACD_9C00188G0005 [uncultured bacterium]|nr:MAG: hypothetical protein ACD_9C00188G0005 [uncultured bacterium]
MIMNRKYITISLTIFSLAILLIGVYFALGKSKREVAYVQTITTDQPNVTEQNIEAGEPQVEIAVEEVDEKKDTEEIETVKPAPPEKTVVKKVVEETEEKNETGKIVNKLISWGFQKATDRKIDTIIVHSSYDALGDDPYSVDGIIAIYKQYAVGAHYLIARDGVIYRLVEDKNIAYHAGVSEVPDGRTNVNAFSIGIEMINTKDGKYTDEQYDALNGLIGNLQKDNEIKYILGHDEIAPDRKTDPWNIDWKRVDR